MGPYVLDFFCEAAMLNIELDGDQHDDPVNRKRDQRRDAWLASRGIEVLRFWNGRLRREKEVVRQVIWETLQERASDPLREEDG